MGWKLMFMPQCSKVECEIKSYKFHLEINLIMSLFTNQNQVLDTARLIVK